MKKIKYITVILLISLVPFMGGWRKAVGILAKKGWECVTDAYKSTKAHYDEYKKLDYEDRMKHPLCRYCGGGKKVYCRACSGGGMFLTPYGWMVCSHCEYGLVDCPACWGTGYRIK